MASTAAPPRAAEICKRFRVSEAAEAHPPGDLTAAAYLEKLRQHECYRDAVFFLAMGLPLPEALWWGCLCVWKLERPKPRAEADVALRTVVEWVQAPGEPRRRAAEQAAEAGGGERSGNSGPRRFLQRRQPVPRRTSAGAAAAVPRPSDWWPAPLSPSSARHHPPPAAIPGPRSCASEATSPRGRTAGSSWETSWNRSLTCRS